MRRARTYRRTHLHVKEKKKKKKTQSQRSTDTHTHTHVEKKKHNTQPHTHTYKHHNNLFFKKETRTNDSNERSQTKSGYVFTLSDNILKVLSRWKSNNPSALIITCPK